MSMSKKLFALDPGLMGFLFQTPDKELHAHVQSITNGDTAQGVCLQLNQVTYTVTEEIFPPVKAPGVQIGTLVYFDHYGEIYRVVTNDVVVYAHEIDN